jgi:hypothetical protein
MASLTRLAEFLDGRGYSSTKVAMEWMPQVRSH